jgi:3-oxoacyl-[acyl-carrier protein] reductase
MKVVLITGATRGIGAAIADVLDGPDAKLILTGANVEAVDRLNKAAPPKRQYVCVDFSAPESLERFVTFVGNLDQLDVCVNNAGINIIKPMEDVTASEMDLLQTVNYKAPYLICQAAAAVMRKQGRGRIVNIASIWSRVTKPGRKLYTGSKTALVGVTRSMAVELAPDNVLVNCVSPGFTLTELTRRSLSDAEITAISGQIPQARMADPVEIAKVVRFLCSEDNTYMTGQNLVVDGGFSIV